MATILGAAKYDISMLMTYVAADKYLIRGGKLGFVLPQNLFKSAAAGQGFRRFSLPDSTMIFPISVDDMVQLNPFEGASNRTAVAVFGKGWLRSYPVSYQLWRKRTIGRGSGVGFDTPYEDVTSAKITYRDWYAQPITPTDMTSAWITGRKKALRALQTVVGASEYRAREGTNTGGANGVYWLDISGRRPDGKLVISNYTDRAKKKVTKTQATVEPDLIYPLLRGAEVSRWTATPSLSIVITHEHGEKLHAIPVKRMEEEFPKTLAYLSKFEDFLCTRPAFKRYFKAGAPFYSMFNIGNYSFSPHKVVWREQASGMTAAVIGELDGKSIMPDHKLMMVETVSEEEAHYLCALLNSAPVQFAVASYAIEIQLGPHILENIAIPKFTRKDDVHKELARLGRAAKKAAQHGDVTELIEVEKNINKVAGMLWGLTHAELAELETSLTEL